ncbi:hypothetical protein IMG5_113910 [Ichthyophthirius multifiliis]|uniref:C2 domain-containing protein n=1 Tax=Ichthyophthirius multifiliis TaxID=5932 RepID=G0QU14_ICHMU|nr:hypothetical protein IMG5_113910 [Ichthyophthirius multifiliis]EGR31293.1 hypothetical protein IMG5_113910 [Ichthyophthirius multifiliis]|eukprot:XP_004034779.1 hypothetical protein IMG5_113910 [Ichthyophthirius multifiliis]
MQQNQQKVSLNFNCTGLNGSDGSFTSYLKIYINENKGEFQFLGQTDVMKRDPHPKFAKIFYTLFQLTKIQNIRIEVWEVHTIGKDTLYGQVNTTLVDIIIDLTNNFTLSVVCPNKIDKTGQIHMRAGNVGTNCVQWTWAGRKLKNMDTFSKSDPFLQFFYLNDNGEKIFVGQTETIMDNNEPVWKPFEMSLSTLCMSDLNRKFQIDVRDWEQSENYKTIGSVKTTINELLEKQGAQLEIIDSKNSFGGHLSCTHVTVSKPCFVDYIMGGQQINVIANIDFTASNGEYSDPNSLHCQDLKKNQYLITLKAITNILLAFDYDKRIELFGFGGVPQYPNFKSYDTDHCFPLTGDHKNPSVLGLDGILNVYQESLKNVTLCGPTLFGPSLKKGMEIAKQNAQKNIYTIQLILTDGVIDDFEESQRLLSMGGSLPWSVIIVGVGNDRFESMKALDGHDVKTQADGVQLKRDICQFVKFQDYQNDHQELVQQVLAEIPNQFQSYKLAKKEYVITAKPVHTAISSDVKVVANQVGGYQGNAYSHCTQSNYVCGSSYSTNTVVKTTITTTKVTYKVEQAE